MKYIKQLGIILGIACIGKGIWKSGKYLLCLKGSLFFIKVIISHGIVLLIYPIPIRLRNLNWMKKTENLRKQAER